MSVMIMEGILGLQCNFTGLEVRLEIRRDE